MKALICWLGHCLAFLVDTVFYSPPAAGNSFINFGSSISIDKNQGRWKRAADSDKISRLQCSDVGRMFANLLSASAEPLYLVIDAQERIACETISTYHPIQFLSNVGCS